jgi:alkane 1-monooxygenase
MEASSPEVIVPRALPFYVAFLIPGSAVLGLALGGPWTWATVIWVFAITPLLDAVIGRNRWNPARAERGVPPQRRPVFDLALWLWLPVHIAVVTWGIWTAAHVPMRPSELLGLTLSVGICSGSGAINVAHELMHRAGRLEKGLAELLLLTVLYPHFAIEHLRGHHRHVATPMDPASARLGESVFAFLPRTLIGSGRSAWQIEADRISRAGRGPLGLGDRRFRYALELAALIAGIAVVTGLAGVGFFLAQSAVAFVLLEIINYVEHYGLERRQLANGKYERVTPQHSWNASQRLTNWYLFNLQRHADHHAFAARPYWLLHHIEDSPQLPAGYATMALLALVPPLWHRLMDPKAQAWRERHLGAAEATKA